MIQNGKTLSMHSDAIWKGEFTHNGMLLKVHENAYTIGYSALLKADGTEGAVVKFGDGVFLDAHQQNNKVYAGQPTVASAVPVFAGIIVREPAIASGYPVLNDEVAPFQKGMICREGFVEYKKAGVKGQVGSVALLEKGVTYGYNMFVSNTNGSVLFASTSSETGYTLAGKVVAINPDDQTVTVKVSI